MKYGIYYQGKFVKIKDFRQLDPHTLVYAIAENDDEKVVIKKPDGTEIVYDFFILKRIEDVQNEDSPACPRYQQVPCTSKTLKDLVMQAIQIEEVAIPKTVKIREIYEYFNPPGEKA